VFGNGDDATVKFHKNEGKLLPRWEMHHPSPKPAWVIKNTKLYANWSITKQTTTVNTR